jgi:hypothetical protein
MGLASPSVRSEAVAAVPAAIAPRAKRIIPPPPFPDGAAGEAIVTRVRARTRANP